MEQSRKEREWSLTLGIYPGILLGFRSYREETYTTHVLYMPFIDLAFVIDN